MNKNGLFFMTSCFSVPEYVFLVKKKFPLTRTRKYRSIGRCGWVDKAREIDDIGFRNEVLMGFHMAISLIHPSGCRGVETRKETSTRDEGLRVTCV